MAQDALLLLEDEQALALHPDGDGLVVFDGQTGEGAECCCGGALGACCTTTGFIECTTPRATSPTTKCGRRVDLQLSGTLTHDSRFLPRSGSPVIVYRNQVSANLSVYWKLADETGQDPTCGTLIGYNGASTRTSVGENNGGDAWNFTKADTTFLTGLPTLNRGWSRTFTPEPYLAPCQWSAFAVGGGPSQLPPGAAVVLFDPAAIVKNGNPTVGFDASTGINTSESWFPGSVLGVECNGTRSKTLRPGFSNEQQADLTWSASSGASGGSFSLSFSLRTGRADRDHDVESWVMSGTWSMAVTLCIGDGSSGAGWPGCEAFRAAFIAGDAAADIDGDGFVTGKDFDLVLAEHPECGGFADSGSIGALVNRLRAQRRPAVRGAASAAALLGLP